MDENTKKNHYIDLRMITVKGIKQIKATYINHDEFYHESKRIRYKWIKIDDERRNHERIYLNGVIINDNSEAGKHKIITID